MPHDVSVVGPLNIDLLIRGEGPSNWEAIPMWDGPADMEMTAAGSERSHDHEFRSQRQASQRRC